MNESNLVPMLLMMLLGASLASAAAIVMFARNARKRSHPEAPGPAPTSQLPVVESAIQRTGCFHRPCSWLAIRNCNRQAIQSALGLRNAKPCGWIEGLTGIQPLFISPSVKGWTLIAGSDLPDPGDDIDQCFRFLVELSRNLGQVQLFHMNQVLNHHGWARLDGGRVIRAYAWAGRTLWNQGMETRAELDLGLRCFQYFQEPDRPLFGQQDPIAATTEKVPLLAARWSFDPADIDERVLEQTRGIVGVTRFH